MRNGNSGVLQPIKQQLAYLPDSQLRSVVKPEPLKYLVEIQMALLKMTPLGLQLMVQLEIHNMLL
jgi:hypothetical protein